MNLWTHRCTATQGLYCLYFRCFVLKNWSRDWSFEPSQGRNPVTVFCCCCRQQIPAQDSDYFFFPFIVACRGGSCCHYVCTFCPCQPLWLESSFYTWGVVHDVLLGCDSGSRFDDHYYNDYGCNGRAYQISANVCVCVCVFSSHPFWTSSSLDVPAGVTQEEGHTGFLVHLPSAVRALIFVARRIQPFLSLVDREVEFCVLTN